MSAAGEPISVLWQISLPIQLGGIIMDHLFVVARSLIKNTPVVLGIDFMQKHGLVLDFTTIPTGKNQYTCVYERNSVY